MDIALPFLTENLNSFNYASYLYTNCLKSLDRYTNLLRDYAHGRVIVLSEDNHLYAQDATFHPYQPHGSTIQHRDVMVELPYGVAVQLGVMLWAMVMPLMIGQQVKPENRRNLLRLLSVRVS